MKKIMKTRLTALFCAVALVLGLCPHVHAEEHTAAPVITLSSVQVSQGGTCTVYVTGENLSALTSAELIVTYDPSAMSVSRTSTSSMDLGTVDTSTPGFIRYSGISDSGISGSNRLFQITFSIDPDADIRTYNLLTMVLASTAIVDGEETDILLSAQSGSITVTEAVTSVPKLNFSLSAGSSSVEAGETVDFTVYCGNVYSLAGGQFVFQYDSDLFTYENLELLTPMTKAEYIYSVNAANAGQVVMSYASDAAVTGGNLMRLTLRAKDGASGSSNVEFLPNSLVDIDEHSLQFSSAKRSVTITEKNEDPVYPALSITLPDDLNVQDAFTAECWIEGTAGLAAGDFVLLYDCEALECIAVYGEQDAGDDDTSNGYVIINDDYTNGRIAFSVLNGTGIQEDTRLISARFRAKIYSEIEITLTPEALSTPVDSKLASIQLEYIPATAQLSVPVYTVEFRDWDGTVLDTCSVPYMSAASVSAPPSRDYTDEIHYIFTGWSDDVSAVTEDLVVTAVYLQEAHSFTNYISNGDSSCTEDGTKTATCDGCPVTSTVADTGSMKGHTDSEAVIENDVKPDCVTAGSYENVVYCADCGAELSRTKIPVSELGHRVIVDTTQLVDPVVIENTEFVFTDGAYYSSNHEDGSSSEFRIIAEYDCTLTLYSSVSSERNYDKLSILLNDIQKQSISGLVTDQILTLSLNAGDVVTVRYTKDVSVSSYDDCGWVSLEYDFVAIESTEEVPADTLEPSCTDGVVCSYCHVVVEPALGHTYGDWIDNGVDSHVRHCPTCDEYDYSNHVYSDWTDDENGQHAHSCSVCGRQESAEHNFGNWVDDGNGNHTHSCPVCDTTERSPHSFTNYVSNKDATCTADGTKTAACDYCAATSTVTDAGSKKGHTYGNWIDALDEGHFRVCDTCQDIERSTHDYGNWLNDDDVTHVRYCQTCDGFDRGGHEYGDWFDDGNGMHAHRCSVCDRLDSAYHSFGNWVDDGSGNHTHSCPVCDATEGGPHNYSDWIDDLEDGHFRICDTCQDIERSSHDYGDWRDNDDASHERYCPTCGGYDYGDHAYGDWFDDGNGMHAHRCSVCDRLDSAYHIFSDWTDIGNGMHARTCSLCYCAEIVPHTYSDWEDDDEVTHVRYCLTCDGFDRGDHTYGDWTDDGNGMHTHSCSVCGRLESADHSFDDWTDTGYGQHAHRCSFCGLQESADHSFDDWSDDGDGNHSHSCPVCDATERTPHNFTNYVSNNDATCVADGTKTGKCSGCDVTNTVVDAGSMKSHTSGEAVTENEVDPDCTNPGSFELVVYCTNCGTELSRVVASHPPMGHSFTTYVSDNNASCTEDGTKTAKCDRCDVTNTVVDSGTMLPHSFSDWADAEDGQHYRICFECGYSEAAAHYFYDWLDRGDGTHGRICGICDYVDVADHDYSTWLSGDDETHFRVCDSCGNIDRREHSYSAWTESGDVSHSRTCYDCSFVQSVQHFYGSWTENGDGTRTHTCVDCNFSETVQHEFGQWIKYDEHTHIRVCTLCDHTESRAHSFGSWNNTDGGMHIRSCSVCDATESEIHDFGPWSDAGNGTHSRTCSSCSAKDSENHHFTAYVSDNNATCTADGTKTAKCDRCNATDTVADAGSKKNHTRGEAVTENEVKPGCTTPGSYDSVIYCSACGTELTRTSIPVPAQGHSFTAYVSDNNATCTADGTKTAKCDRCDATDTVVDAGSKKNHTRGEAVTENEVKPGCTTPGSYDSVTYCSACGTELTRTSIPVPALGHSNTYQAIDGELYRVCGNCSDREIARTVIWNGQNIAVKLAAELQPTWLYGALYDSDDHLVEVSVVEVTAAETVIPFSHNADYAKVFFLNKTFAPWLNVATLP